VIDWAATGSWMQAWAGFANAAVIGWAAVKGSSTLKTWLAQRQLDRKLSAAERLLPYAYRAREAFHSIRNPMSGAGEVAEVQRSLATQYEDYDNMEGGRRQRLQTSQTAVARIAHHAELWSELSDLLPLARMYFGDQAENKFRDIWRQRQKLWASAMVYPDIDRRQNKELVERCEADFWEGYGAHNGAGDLISAALDEIVAYAEAQLRPLLSSETNKTLR
jgi:hypothetical protein